MDSELDQVVQALELLYSPSTVPSLQSTLQHQLLQVQLDPRLGWSLIAPFLHHPDPIVRFFGAATLEQKLNKQFDQLAGQPPDDRNGLRTSLLTWLGESARAAYPPPTTTTPGGGGGGGKPGEKPVLRKLTVALVTFTLKLFLLSSNERRGQGQRQDEVWQDWLLEVMVRVSASGATREAGLEVLSVAIEQVARAELTGSKRMAYMNSLTSSIPHLVATLTQSLSSPSAPPSELNLALTCFVSYLSAGQLSHSDLSTLYPLLLHHLSNPHTLVAACSAVEELVERSSGLGGSGSGSGSGVTKFMNRFRTNELIERWVSSRMVRDWVEEAVVEAKEEGGGDEVDDEKLAVFKLVCTVGEHFISTFLFDPLPPPPPSSLPTSTTTTSTTSSLDLTSPSVHTLFHLLLELTRFPGHSPSGSYPINELATGCWMALQEYGADEGFVLGGEATTRGAGGGGDKEGQWRVYKGVWSELVEALRGRAVRPKLTEFENWPKDVKDGFRVYRNTVLVDPIQYAYYVLREEMLAGLVELASQQVVRPVEDGKDGHEELEATLFTINCLSECIPMSPSQPSLSASTSSTVSTTTTLTSQYLSYLFSSEILGRLASFSPARHPSLLSTLLKVIGSYSPWFATTDGQQHPSSSSTTSSASSSPLLLSIQFVVTCLLSSDSSMTRSVPVVGDAVRALKRLCDHNRKQLTGHVGEFVGVLGGLEGKVDEGELAKVLESVASVVQALEPDLLVDPLLTLTNPIISSLQTASDRGQTSSSSEESRLSALQQLVYLTSLSKGLSTPEPEILDLDTSFDDTVIKENAQRVGEDARVVEMRLRLGVAVEATARVWAGDVEVVSALSDFIRNSTSDSIPSPLTLDPLLLLSLCASALQAAPSSIWLGISGSLLARLARERSDRSLQSDELASVGRPVEAMLNLVLSTHGDLSAMNENPDVVSSFLSFCSQIVRHYPSIFLALPAHYLDAVLAFAERGLGMQEQFSLKSTIELLLTSVQQTKMASAFSTVFASTLVSRVPSLIRSTLVAICGAVPRSHLISLSELLHACLLRMPEQARPALKELLGSPGWPNERTSDEAKGKFERAVLSARTGRQVRQAVNDFALLARGLDGTAYGAATI